MQLGVYWANVCMCVCVCSRMSWGPVLESTSAPKVISIAVSLSLIYIYIYISQLSSFVCERECGGVPSVLAWVSLYQVGWRLSETKACLCSSISFALHWWESSAPLIVFSVLGQGTPISLCSGEGVWARVRACSACICATAQNWCSFIFPHMPISSLCTCLLVSSLQLCTPEPTIYTIEVLLWDVCSRCDGNLKEYFDIRCIKPKNNCIKSD